MHQPYSAYTHMLLIKQFCICVVMSLKIADHDQQGLRAAGSGNRPSKAADHGLLREFLLCSLSNWSYCSGPIVVKVLLQGYLIVQTQADQGSHTQLQRKAHADAVHNSTLFDDP